MLENIVDIFSLKSLCDWLELCVVIGLEGVLLWLAHCRWMISGMEGLIYWELFFARIWLEGFGADLRAVGMEALVVECGWMIWCRFSNNVIKLL